MTAALYQTPTVFKGWVYGYADRWTGAYSLVWPANASVAGTHFIQVWSEIGYFPVQSANFTLT
jgi:hypothetical protein